MLRATQEVAHASPMSSPRERACHCHLSAGLMGTPGHRNLTRVWVGSGLRAAGEVTTEGLTLFLPRVRSGVCAPQHTGLALWEPPWRAPCPTCGAGVARGGEGHRTGENRRHPRASGLEPLRRETPAHLSPAKAPAVLATPVNKTERARTGQRGRLWLPVAPRPRADPGGPGASNTQAGGSCSYSSRSSPNRKPAQEGARSWMLTEMPLRERGGGCEAPRGGCHPTKPAAGPLSSQSLETTQGAQDPAWLRPTATPQSQPPSQGGHSPCSGQKGQRQCMLITAHEFQK